MECKKALVAANGDMDLAGENLLKSGVAKADKKSDRVANEGLLFTVTDANNMAASIVEINCETDFVARGDDFKGFGERLAELALSHKVSVVDSLLSLQYDSENTVEDMRKIMISKLGENIQVRRAYAMHADSGCVTNYSHSGRIVTLVKLSDANIEVAKDVAMHAAAMKPTAISSDGVPSDVVAKQREIFAAQVAASGKPENIAARIIEGKINKYLNENSLLGQVFVKDSKQKVSQYVDQHKCKVLSYVLYEIGMAGNDGEITQ
ncbi:MAG: translation elongation factor Ts, partial [Legionellales bacterium]|nr:translation elongation factor Ts [Legionellales bacterium]